MRSFSISKLMAAKSKYDKEIAALEDRLSPFIEFDFFIIWQQGDGFVIVSDDVNSSLEKCIEIIQKEEKLTFNDFLENSI